jgi:hypothetical protein
VVDFVDDTGFVVVASSSDVMKKSVSICIKAKREIEAEAGEEEGKKSETRRLAIRSSVAVVVVAPALP